MRIQNWSEDIILVDLQREPQMMDELKTVMILKISLEKLKVKYLEVVVKRIKTIKHQY